MSRLEEDLIREARRKYKQIYPCASRTRLEDCFSTMGDKYVFWFNTADHSTRVVSVELSGAQVQSA